MQPRCAIEPWAGLNELRPLLEAYLSRRCRDESEVDDVVQETLIRASRYRGSLADSKHLHHWVRRIALNILRDQVRRERRLPRVEADDELFDLIEGREGIPGESHEDLQLCVEGEKVGKRLALRELGAAKRRMHEPDQTVLDSYYAAAGGCREAARVCELTPDLVKVRLFRARRRLRSAVRLGLRFTRDPWEGVGDGLECDGLESRGEVALCASLAETVESGAYDAAEG